MNQILNSYYQLSPLFIFFALGIILVKTKVFERDMGRSLLKFNFYLPLSFLVFQTVSKIEFNKKYIVYIFLYVMLYVVGIGISYFFVKRIFNTPQSIGAAILICAVPNNGFILPFIIQKFGKFGVERYIATDIPNWLLVCTLGYGIAVYFGHKGKPSIHNDKKEKNRIKKVIISKLFLAPPLWGILLGLMVNFFDIKIPEPIDLSIEKIIALVVPITIIAVGMIFDIKLHRIKQVIKVLSFHYIVQIIVLIITIAIFKPSGKELTVLSMLAITPTAFNAITFSSLEDLDHELASEAISLSIPIGMIITPLIIALV